MAAILRGCVRRSHLSGAECFRQASQQQKGAVGGAVLLLVIGTPGFLLFQRLVGGTGGSPQQFHAPRRPVRMMNEADAGGGRDRHPLVKEGAADGGTDPVERGRQPALRLVDEDAGEAGRRHMVKPGAFRQAGGDAAGAIDLERIGADLAKNPGQFGILLGRSGVDGHHGQAGAIADGRIGQQSVDVREEAEAVRQRGDGMQVADRAPGLDMRHRHRRQVAKGLFLLGRQGGAGPVVDHADGAECQPVRRPQRGAGIEPDVRVAGHQRVGGEPMVPASVADHEKGIGLKRMGAEGLLSRCFPHRQPHP